MNGVVQPRLGQFVKVIRGKDQNKFAVIVGLVDHRLVLIADGDKRRFDQPKKKNLLHLHLLDACSSEIVNSLLESERVSNRKLKEALSKLDEAMIPETQEKGE